MGSDLHALSQLNDMCKYADDTTLLVPEHTDTDIDIEFDRVKLWALNNHLTLKLTKTKETYIHCESKKTRHYNIVHSFAKC